MRLNTIKAALLSAFLATAAPISDSGAQSLSVRFNGGEKFTHNVSYNHSPGTRTITVDCSRMEPVRMKDGSKRLAATAAFIDLFNVLNAEGMSGYSDAQRKAIQQASSNRSIDPTTVTFLVSHVVGAHGVKYEEIRAAGRQCEARANFP